MKNAKLTALTVQRFKSFKESTRIELAPLTIILGRNNSGKSSLIQSLLLLKQTLNDPRPDVMLRLDGIVEAFNLRELTFGWPTKAIRAEGPVITLEWECEMDKHAMSLLEIGLKDLNKKLGVDKYQVPKKGFLKTFLTLHTDEVRNDAIISKIEIKSHNGFADVFIEFVYENDKWSCYWDRQIISKIDTDVDHFIPLLRFNFAEDTTQDDIEFQWRRYYRILLSDSLDALKKLLSEFHYLGSNRQSPPSLFKPATTPPNEIGINGELAAQLLHRRQHDSVHFLPPLQVVDGVETKPPDKICELSLVDAVNRVMQDLSISTPLKVKEIEQVGFQLMFGDASIVHVGRGLNSLLPLVELGLFADPLRFVGDCGDMSLAEYQKKCESYSHIALEEPEAHLHPKVASRLAHWMVSLAMANRRLMVETHSDHLVRRLRGLAARAGRGSELERWLLENVVILSVEQAEDGSSTVTSSRLTAEGGVEEKWPADFMDEATDEESAIYYARLDKMEAESSSGGNELLEVIEGDEPELDEEP